MYVSFRVFSWQVGIMKHNVDEVSDELVSRQLEAFILFLFGWVMFVNSHGHNMDKRMICIAKTIVDADTEMP